MHDGRPDHRRLHGRQQQILEYIDAETRRRGYPPSVREITRAVRLKSPSTTQYHLEKLIRQGWLQRDENSPRALRVAYDWQTGARGERRATRYVPLVGDVAAGADVVAQENVEQLLPLPLDFTGEGELFMLRVRGDS
ncbi:MAG TPA: transcriptional repressor LexA, partial [Acidimicrobiaceae bacterium]|nr:transcriptional repressor LexA [Acidimicrobiaceae bacterium]